MGDKVKLQEVSRRELLLHATLLLRTVNRYQSKEEQMEYFESFSHEELVEYIDQFREPQPEIDWTEVELRTWENADTTKNFWGNAASSADYSPSHPWNAPGMSVRDFL